ncbi:hypothetical protein [Chamaesiphon sp.]
MRVVTATLGHSTTPLKIAERVFTPESQSRCVNDRNFTNALAAGMYYC